MHFQRNLSPQISKNDVSRVLDVYFGNCISFHVFLCVQGRHRLIAFCRLCLTA